ncbi:MAG TPA: ubiquinol-cytochrome c reductase cytochrome b subunit [Candidatus Baltobacteraceae bacterium]|nr:ubiquinol-cytochrome c reductase cytochrome b subunit [Candidatus Baltobacteraceae bacterium]
MIVRRIVSYLDDRLGSSAFIKAALCKVFPDHWAFMLGEICVYAFIALLITGTYIAFFFNDSAAPVVYHGPYASLDGRSLPASYASVLNFSFNTRLGLLIRQMHHWAALVFVGAILFHMMRIFFTGAFRKPREMNWTLGVLLFLLAMAEGFCGYSLPGDSLSGAGLRIAYSVAESMPFVGTWLAFFIFGGPFPAADTTQRLTILHVWIVPIVIIGAISLHIGMVWRQHHTQFAGPRRTEGNVVGSTLWPGYALKSLALMSATFAVLAFLGGFFTINPIWIYGPYEGWNIASPAQPDWYVGWLDGALRLGPAFALHVFGHTVSPLFWSGILMPGLLFTALLAWPEIERAITRDNRQHNLDDMPYEKPWRLGLGIAVITFGTVLGFAASDDIQAKLFHVDVEHLMVFYRFMAVLAPPLFGAIAVRIGFELRARFESAPGQGQVRRATLRRNAEGGFDEERKSTRPA